MSSSAAAAPTTSQIGKPPVLLGTSPKDLRSFLHAAKMFFSLKSISTDEAKISWLGAGLGRHPELESWYLSAQTEHDAKKYDDFVADLQKRALPNDFVWDLEGRIRTSMQGDRDYLEWSQALRADQLVLTDRLMSTNELVKCLLYNMDPELSSVLRRGKALDGSGFHEDDQTTLFLSASSATPAVRKSVDYEKFDREARDEWERIARRRAATQAQVKQLTKRTATTSLTTSSSSSTRRSQTSSPAPETNETGQRLAKLTSVEKAWLTANRGCFQCRKILPGHDWKECKERPPSDFKIDIPAGWKPGDPVPSSKATTSSSSKTTVTVGAVQAGREIDLPESLADDSDTASDE